MSQPVPISSLAHITTQRTLLVGSGISSELKLKLEQNGFRVTTVPELEINPPASFAMLDEAIANLFGYDWIVFVSASAVRYFLERFLTAEHDISDLDSLRVCAIGDATLDALEQQHIHVDVAPQHSLSAQVIEHIAAYAGGAESLNRTNFLIPQAAIGRDYIKPQLEDAGARADVLVAYQTVLAADALRLVGLQTLLVSGAVDAVLFTAPDEVRDFARLFDTHDLSRPLTNVAVTCLDNETSAAAARLGLRTTIAGGSGSAQNITDAMVGYSER